MHIKTRSQKRKERIIDIIVIGSLIILVVCVYMFGSVCRGNSLEANNATCVKIIN